MSGLQLHFGKFTIFLLCLLKVQGEKPELIAGSFFYDTPRQDLLFETVKEIQNNVKKVEGMLAVQHELLSKTSTLEDQNLELDKKLLTLFEQFNDLMQKSNEKENQNKTETEKETCLELDRKFEEFKASQSGKTSMILQEINKSKEKLDNTEGVVIKKLEEIDEHLLLARTGNDETFKALQKVNLSLVELRNVTEEEIRFLDNLNETHCGTKDSIIPVKVKNFDQFRNEALSVRNKSSILYSGCEEAVKYNGRSGVYSLRIFNSKFSTFKAYCLEDLKGNETAWTIMERRDEHSGHFIDFNRTWEEYKNGFGDLEYDHWLGLQKIFDLTNSGRYELWELWINDKEQNEETYYDDFKISDEYDNFTITSVGKTKDPLKTCLNTPFNTFDRGDINYVDSKGGGGFWGPCYLNYNKQDNAGTSDMKIGVISFGIHDYYLHLALRPTIIQVKV